MGTIIDAYCSCGFRSDMLFVGYGFSAIVPGHEEPLWEHVPAYCPKCKMLNIVDRKSRTRNCEQCGGKVILYGRNKKVSDNKVQLENLYKQKSTGHLCPSCQRFTLIFEHNGGMFD